MIEDILNREDVNQFKMKRALKCLCEYFEWSLDTLDKQWRDIKREDIYCLKGNYCFRDYLDKRYKNVVSKNTVLYQLELFFSLMIIDYAMETGEFLDNPVIKKWDKFKVQRHYSTSRSVIPKEVLNDMRGLLIKDDFAFVKALGEDFKDGVYCPSRGIQLFLLLVYPLRSMQVRLLDSGIENPKEGLVQKIYYSGVCKEKNYALYINTNKSGEGYVIPWVSMEVLNILKKQYEWISEYGRDVVLYKKYIKREDRKINPLFLDWNRNVVSRESLMKLWKRLCDEYYKISGVKVESDLHSLRVSLISYGIAVVGNISLIGASFSGQDSTTANHYFRVEDLRALVDKKVLEVDYAQQ